MTTLMRQYRLFYDNVPLFSACLLSECTSVVSKLLDTQNGKGMCKQKVKHDSPDTHWHLAKWESYQFIP